MNKYYLDIKIPELYVKILLQIRDNNCNVGQGRIKKVLKTMYHIYYNGSNYSVKKSDLKYNIHGQIVAEIKNLNKIK